MATITLEDIQRNPLHYLERVKAGETLVVVQADEPIIELRPIAASPRPTSLRPSGLAAGEFTVPDDFDEPMILTSAKGKVTVRQVATWAGRSLTVSWLPGPTLPPQELVTQVGGVCFTQEGKVVLARDRADDSWMIPGGHIEAGESFLETLSREVDEEACADILHHAYLGAALIEDPDNPEGKSRYYQLRFWTRVALKPFAARFETSERVTVSPNEVLGRLDWSTPHTAAAMLEAALHEEARFLAQS